MTSKEESKYLIGHILLEKRPDIFKKYEGIRTELESTLERINDPYYSEHGLVHCDNILRNIDSIVPFDIKDKMGKNELFCVLCSILLHDIGRIKQNEPYESFKETNKDHARRTFEWIIENGERLGLEIPYIKPIAWICWGHGDVEKVEYEIKDTFNNCMVPIENEEIDIRFLISLLRLGDVLDIGFRRTPKHAIASLWKIPGSEIKYILKDYLTHAVIINPTGWKIEITLRKPSNIDDALFSDIKTNLIKNKCGGVLKSTMEHLERRDIYFRLIDVQTIKSEPEETIKRLLEEGITKRTFAEMAEEYEEATSRVKSYTKTFSSDAVLAEEYEKYEEKGEIIPFPTKSTDEKKKQKGGNLMDVIILVGGYAKRLWPLTQDKPKSLLKIMEKEILSYILDDLNNFDNVGHIYVSTNREFKKHFIDFLNVHSYSMDIELIIEPHAIYGEKLGPNGGLEYVRKVKGTRDYMIIAGDNMFEYSLLDFLNFYMKRNKSVIALQLPPFLRDMSQFGIVEVDRTDAIIEFDEKPTWPENKFISTGCYILKQEDFDLMPNYIEAGEDIDSLGEFMRWLAKDKKRGILGYQFNDEWFDVGTLDTLLLANRYYLRSDNLGVITGDVEIKDNVYINKGTIIKDSEIGPNVYVGKNCVITESKIADALIYDNVTINEGEIQHSVIDEGSSVRGKMSGIIAR